MKILKGETVEEQMKSVDTMLSRYSRRLHKTVKGIITPYPISNYIDVPIKDVALKYMFPIEGTLLIGHIYIEQMPEEGVDIFMVLGLEDKFKSEQIFTKENFVVMRPNLLIEAGSRLTVSVKPKGGSRVTGIWTALLWEPNVKETVVKKFLIDELDKVGKDNVDFLRQE